MSQTVTSALATKDNGPGALVERYSQDFTEVLPSHVKPAAWLRLAQGALRRNPQLAKAAQGNPGSFMSALLECARLGLEPGSEEYYLVPYGSEVQGLVGYQGEIELIYRAGAVSSVKAELVYSNDGFAYDPSMDKPNHTVDWFGNRGELRGAYAYAQMKDGSTSRVVIIDATYISKVKAMAKGSSSPSSPWVKWPESMYLKTAVHQLAKWVPTSAEYRREQLRAVQDVAAETRPPRVDHIDTDTGEVLNAEIVDEP